MANKIPTVNLEILSKHSENTGNFVRSSCNSLTLKIQDIVIFAAKFSIFSKSVSHMNVSHISEIGTGKISSWTGKKLGKHREFANSISVGTLFFTTLFMGRSRLRIWGKCITGLDGIDQS